MACNNATARQRRGAMLAQRAPWARRAAVHDMFARCRRRRHV